METAAEFDFAALSPDSLSLKVENDEAGTRAIWNADRNRALAWNCSKPRLDDQRYPVILNFPVCVVGKPTMWQRCLSPTSIDKADFAFLNSHIGRRCVQDPAIHFALKQFLLALLHEQPVNFAHMPACPSDLREGWPPRWSFVILDFAGVATKCLVDLLVYPVKSSG